MTHLKFDIRAEVPLEKSIEGILYETVSAVLEHEQVSQNATLTILITDDETMRQLNRDFAGLDEPTDVLSFPAGNGSDLLPEELDGYLGDIAISMMKAERQAKEGCHSLTAELQLLTVHGVLHLLGYDHYYPEERAAMWTAQQAILDTLGVEVTIPSK